MFSALLSALGDGGFTTYVLAFFARHVDVGQLSPDPLSFSDHPVPLRPRAAASRLAGPSACTRFNSL